MVEPTISSSIEQICQEKKLSKEQVLVAIEQALASAYRKDFGHKMQNLKVEFNPENGKMRVFDEKTVVEDLPEESLPAQAGLPAAGGNTEIAKKTPNLPPETNKNHSKTKRKKGENLLSDLSQSKSTTVDEGRKLDKEFPPAADETTEEKEKRFNPKTEIQLSEALQNSAWQNLSNPNKKIKIGDIIRQELETPSNFGRIAAQTAKQVIIQRLREAERETIFEKYAGLIGTVTNAIVQRRERQTIFVDLIDTSAIMPYHEQVQEEKYWPEQKIKVYLVAINKTVKGPEIIVSRRHPDILKELFKIEIPEIANGAVEIKAIAREAGSRSKVAVFTSEKSIDPIGAAIGQRGVRIQTIINEIGGEKIDIIEYSDDPEKFITNALSPAKISSIKINKKEKSALTKAKKSQISLAIGKGGQNVRLAAKLTGWKIDIVEDKAEEPEDKKTEEQKNKETEEIKNQETKEQKKEEKKIKKKTVRKKKATE